MKNDRFAVIVACVAVLASLGGCETQQNGWRQFYSPSPRNAVIHPSPTENPQIRTVTPQQVKDWAARANAFFEERHIAPEDISAADGKSLRQLELDAFLIREDPDSVCIIGNSGFDGPQSGSRDDPQLVAFAESVGASFVVLMTEYLGQVDGYTAVPMSTYGFASGNAFVTTSRGGWAQGYSNGVSTSTTYVPVATTFPRYANLAIYFRRISPSERAAIDATFKKGLP